MPEYKQEFIDFAIRTGALKFGEFKLKSGRISPYFFNAGDFADGETISKLTNFYTETVINNYFEEAILYGPAYKGIPLVALTAAKLYEKYRLKYRFSYNRKEVKDHGEGGSIVGTKLTAEDNVLAIEDVVTAGTAIRETKAVLAANGGATLKAMIIAIDRCEVINEGDTKTALQTIAEEEGIQIFPIVTIHEIIEYLYGREIDGKIYIGKPEKEAITSYLEKYGPKKKIFLS